MTQRSTTSVLNRWSCRIAAKAELGDGSYRSVKNVHHTLIFQNKTIAIVAVVVLLFLVTTDNVASARKTRITWVNGIAHQLEHMVEGQVELSKFFGGKPIIFCHNPTAMTDDQDVRGYLTDLTQAGSQKLGLITQEVEALVLHLKEAVAAVGPNGCVVHIAHSQGALVTYLAIRQLSIEEMQRMEVMTFGGAAAIRQTPQTPFKRCINYYAINDPLLMVVPSAEAALRSGLVDHNSEFCFLAPRCGDPVLDHNLWGLTYAQALRWEGDRFLRLYVSPLARVGCAMGPLIERVGGIVIQRLYILLKQSTRPFLIVCVMVYEWTTIVARRIRMWLRILILKPLILLLGMMSEWIQITIMRKQKYQPVSGIPNEA